MNSMKSLLAALLVLFPLYAGAGEPAEKKTTYELELDPYYSAFGMYNSLTGKPIPHMKVASELEIFP